MFGKLEKKGYIRTLSPDLRRVDDSLRLAQRDAKTAQKMLLTEEYDWAFNIAYNSMLQSIRALMFSMGYRPSTRNSHIAVVRFTETALGEDYSICLDRMRRKRHRAVYDMSGTISKTEAHNVVELSLKLIHRVKREIKEK